MNTAFYFFSGMADVFLSLMLWFILEDDETINVYEDGDRIYAIRSDVINPRFSGINNEDCANED